MQGYSAQTVATQDGVIIACATTAEQNDAGWLHPMLDAAQHNLNLAGVKDCIGTLLTDAGYYSDDNITNAADDDLTCSSPPPPSASLAALPPKAPNPIRTPRSAARRSGL